MRFFGRADTESEGTGGPFSGHLYVPATSPGEADWTLGNAAASSSASYAANNEHHGLPAHVRREGFLSG